MEFVATLILGLACVAPVNEPRKACGNWPKTKQAEGTLVSWEKADPHGGIYVSEAGLWAYLVSNDALLQIERYGIRGDHRTHDNAD